MPNERSQLQDGVPVAGGASGAEFLFDESIGEARAADTGRVHHVRFSAANANNLRACDGGLQRLDLFRARRPLQEHDDEMARIALGLLRKKKCPVPLCYVQEAVFRTRRYR